MDIISGRMAHIRALRQKKIGVFEELKERQCDKDTNCVATRNKDGEWRW